jgi:hypothetical protein
VYERGHVLHREDRPDGIWLDVEVPRPLAGLVAPYRQETVGSSESIAPRVAARR